MVELKSILAKFNSWYSSACDIEKNNIPGACCLSTTGKDGYPNARFVSLKETTTKGWIITGSIESQKGQEIEANPKAALSFWWDTSGRQVRIQGNCTLVSEEQADKYFNQRKPESRLVSSTFNQGSPIESYDEVEKKFNQALKNIPEEIERPSYWSALLIQPIRVEFMEFKSNRLHERTMYFLEGGTWKKIILQP